MHGLWKNAVVSVLLMAAIPLGAREKDATQYGAGLIVNVPFSEGEVVQVVQDVIQNGIIRGTKEYNKDEYLSGAAPASSTRVFPAWTEGGKVFYKVRLNALDPRNFKDGNDVGTLAVRYVVKAQDATHTVLRIDARFVEDFRHTGHASNGSVESAEYKDIHDRLDSLQLIKLEGIEAEKEKQARQAKAPVVRKEESSTSSQAAFSSSQPVPAQAASSAPVEAPADIQRSSSSPQNVPPVQTLEERVQDLRRQVQRLVKAPGAPLKSAPFHTAATLQSLSAGTEVLVVVSTPYWLGVETHEGQHGWMLRDDLELVK